MEKFIQKGIDIQKITTEKLNNQYEIMLEEHKKYLYKNITSIIQKHIKGISPTEIESLIDRYFLIDLKYRGRETIDNLCEDLIIDITQVIKNSKNKDKKENLRRYFEYINPTIRRNQIDWLYEITNQFMKQITQKISIHSSPFQGISDNNLKRNIDKLNQELEHFFKSYQDKLNEEYQPLIKEFIENNKTQITQLITEIVLSNKKTESLQMYSAIIELSNYDLVQEDNKYYAKDKSTDELTELTFKDGMLMSVDNQIRYRVDSENKRVGHYNGKTKTSILIHNGLITIMPPKKENQSKEDTISFKKEKTKKGTTVENDYYFYYNLKLIKDFDKLKIAFEQLEKYAPGIYSKLVSDKDFTRLLNEINKKVDNSSLENNKNIQSNESKPTESNNIGLENNNTENNQEQNDTNKRILKQ